MSASPLDAAKTLADVLIDENAALGRLDLPAAADLLPRKLQALDALTAAKPTPGPDATLREMRSLLATLAAENRRLLERAILVQGRVIGCIARAVPRALAGNASGYARNGALAQPRSPNAVAFSARA